MPKAAWSNIILGLKFELFMFFKCKKANIKLCTLWNFECRNCLIAVSSSLLLNLDVQSYKTKYHRLWKSQFYKNQTCSNFVTLWKTKTTFWNWCHSQFANPILSVIVSESQAQIRVTLLVLFFVCLTFRTHHS